MPAISLPTLLRKKTPEEAVELIYDALPDPVDEFNWYGELYAFLFGFVGTLQLIKDRGLVKLDSNDTALQLLSFPVMDRLIRENVLTLHGASHRIDDPEFGIKVSILRQMVTELVTNESAPDEVSYDRSAKPGMQSEAFVELYSKAIAPLRVVLLDKKEV